MINISTREWALFSSLLAYSLVPAFGGLLRVIELGGGPAIVPENPRALGDPGPVVLHVLSSFLFCLVGALQFLPSVRRHYPALHRAAGRLVATAGCVSALTGLWMTHFFPFPDELQGPLLYWVRIALSFGMFGLIVWAVLAIKSRKVLEHGAAMLRAYAIGIGASTQAVFGIGWMVAFGTEMLGPARDGMMVFAWVFNLLMAELLIAKMFAQQSRPIA